MGEDFISVDLPGLSPEGHCDCLLALPATVLLVNTFHT